MMTLFSLADACGESGWERRKVMRVRRVPISTASSAVMDVTPAGRVAGIATAAPWLNSSNFVKSFFEMLKKL